MSSNVSGPRGGSREQQGVLEGDPLSSCPLDDEHSERV